jgi:hypothetical protein
VSTPTRLADVLDAALAGHPPLPDGLVAVVGRPLGAKAAIVAFTGHHVVAADVPPDWVAGLCPPGDLAAPMGPRFVSALAERLRVEAGTQDAVLVARGSAESPLPLVTASAAETRQALMDAPNPRRDCRMWRTTDGSGTVILGRGLEDRWEVAIEVAPALRGRGLGRALALAARSLVGPDEHVIAQIAPGNVASLRAALGAGYTPLAAEILFFDAG